MFVRFTSRTFRLTVCEKMHGEKRQKVTKRKKKWNLKPHLGRARPAQHAEETGIHCPGIMTSTNIRSWTKLVSTFSPRPLSRISSGSFAVVLLVFPVFSLTTSWRPLNHPHLLEGGPLTAICLSTEAFPSVSTRGQPTTDNVPSPQAPFASCH